MALTASTAGATFPLEPSIKCVSQKDMPLLLCVWGGGGEGEERKRPVCVFCNHSFSQWSVINPSHILPDLTWFVKRRHCLKAKESSTGDKGRGDGVMKGGGHEEKRFSVPD